MGVGHQHGAQAANAGGVELRLELLPIGSDTPEDRFREAWPVEVAVDNSWLTPSSNSSVETPRKVIRRSPAGAVVVSLRSVGQPFGSGTSDRATTGVARRARPSDAPARTHRI
ncbi:hypothetical protein [Caulobacter segnis]